MTDLFELFKLLGDTFGSFNVEVNTDLSEPGDMSILITPTSEGSLGIEDLKKIGKLSDDFTVETDQDGKMLLSILLLPKKKVKQ